VEWSEEANVYRCGSQFLVAGAVKQGGKQVSARIDSLARWHELWKLPPTRSVEGVIRFGDRPSATAALCLLAVDDPSGPVPVAGARPAGPRAGGGGRCRPPRPRPALPPSGCHGGVARGARHGTGSRRTPALALAAPRAFGSRLFSKDPATLRIPAGVAARPL